MRLRGLCFSIAWLLAASASAQTVDASRGWDFRHRSDDALVVSGDAAPIALTPDEERALRQRTGQELADAPVPTDADRRALELEIVMGEREEIDLTGTNVLQGFGAGFMIAGGVSCLISVFGVIVSALTGGSPAIVFAAFCGGGGGGGVVVGATLLLAAETDDGLHRRRELDARVRRLRSVSVELSLTGLTLRF